MVMIVLLLTFCVAALSGGLASLGHTERRIAGAHLRSVQTAYAATAAAHLAFDAISRDTNSAYWPSAGTIPSLPGGARVMALAAGETVDLDARTAELNAEAVRLWTVGADTPRWRLAGWGRLPGPPASLRRVAVWVADDVMDGDGMPGEDGNGVLMIHVEAFGARGAAHGVTAHIRRGGGPVQLVSWREG